MSLGVSLLNISPAGDSMSPSCLRCLVLAALSSLTWGCAARSYTYLVDPAPATNPVLEEADGTQRGPRVRVDDDHDRRWNNGEVLTEVEIRFWPAGGVVIEHTAGASGVETLPATGLLPPPPPSLTRPSTPPTGTAVSR